MSAWYRWYRRRFSQLDCKKKCPKALLVFCFVKSFSAIIVAFLGRLHPVGIFFAGLLMSLTYVGGELAQLMLNIPAASIQVFQGMLLFFLLSTDLLVSYKVSLNLGTNNSNPKSKSE